MPKCRYFLMARKSDGAVYEIGAYGHEEGDRAPGIIRSLTAEASMVVIVP